MFSNFRDFGQKFAYQLKDGREGCKYHTSVRRPNLQIADLAIGGNQVFNHSFVHYQIAASHSRFGGALPEIPVRLSDSGAGKDCAFRRG